MQIQDLNQMRYRDAWTLQEQIHTEVAAGGPERILLVEHPPVITFGRRPDVARNLIASDEQLAKLGVEVVQSDRGGDITFHGPGQIVAYPIIRLIDHHLSVGAYVHRLEDAVIATLRDLNVPAPQKDPAAVGVWVPLNDHLAKICAIGVRIRKGITLHGLALNVETDLNFFNLIVPCGLTGRPVTSLRQILPNATHPLPTIKSLLATHLIQAFS